MANYDKYDNVTIARSTSTLGGLNSNLDDWRGNYAYALVGSANDNYYGNYVMFGVNNIEQGATITEAKVHFKCTWKTGSGTIASNVAGEDADNPSLPSDLSDFQDKVRTTANHSYDFSSVVVDSSYSFTVTDIVQEIIDRNNWAAGNRLGIMIMEYTSSLNSGFTFGDESDCYLSVDYTNPVSLPTVTTQDATNIEEATATGNGTITDTGNGNCIARGFVYGNDSHSDPGNTAPGSTAYDNYSGSGGSFSTGSFAYSIGCSAGELCYFRAFAQNSDGYAYGSQLYYYQKPYGPSNLVATGVSQTQINLTWSKGTGAIQTFIRRRFDQYPISMYDGVLVYSGTGTNYSDSPLSCGETYYYRAWSVAGTQVTHSDGYSSDTGITDPCVVAPTVTTQAVTDVGKLTSTSNGNITDDGGDGGATRGMCWSTSTNPTTSDYHATNGTGEGAYTVSMTGLTRNQLYYVRAYSINSEGTSYGSQVSFTTKYAILKRYNGSSWVLASLKTYVGGWTTKPFKVYISGWKEIETL